MTRTGLSDKPTRQPPPSRRNAGLWCVSTRRDQHKVQNEMWLVSGLQDHRYLSVNKDAKMPVDGPLKKQSSVKMRRYVCNQRHAGFTGSICQPVSSHTIGNAVDPSPRGRGPKRIDVDGSPPPPPRKKTPNGPLQGPMQFPHTGVRDCRATGILVPLSKSDTEKRWCCDVLGLWKVVLVAMLYANNTGQRRLLASIMMVAFGRGLWPVARDKLGD